MQLPGDFTNISLITCDVFDTLLVRESITPTRLWKRQGNWFSIFRISSEFIGRVFTHFQGQKEIRIAEIYRLMPKKWSIEDEVKLEISTLRINPEISEWLREASRAGVRVVLVSDIYFSANQLRKIIIAVGGPTYEVITSSDEGITKSTGLFQNLQKRWNVDPCGWMHVGDNGQADVEVPGKLGIETIHYSKLLDQVLIEGVLSKKGVKILLKAGATGEAFITELSLQFALFMVENKHSSKNTPELVGALICAPIAKTIASFVENVAEACGSEAIWFSGRDGWLPFSFFRRENRQFESTYLQVSRVAIASPYFETYLDQMIQGQSEILVFDLGWRGSLLCRLQDLHPEISWHGAFVALIGANKPQQSTMVRFFSRNWFSLVRNRDFIETLFSDPTPGIQAYSSNGIPILKIETDELNQNLRHAILKGAHWAAEKSTQELDLELALRLVRVTSSYPSRKLAECFLGATHEIVEGREKMFVLNSWRNIFHEKDLSWWAGTHALRPANALAGFFWHLTLYAQESYVLANRTLHRFLFKRTH